MSNPELSDSDEIHPAELSIAQRTDTISVLRVSCELDMVTTPAFGQLLTQELDNGHPAVLVEFSGCEFMGCSGLAVLVGAREHATRTGTRLALTGLTRAVRRSLQATRLDSLFTVYATTDDALTGVTPTPEPR